MDDYVKIMADLGALNERALFRDILQSSRKYTIPVLEYFDRTGVTMRVGDVRKLKTGRS